MTDQSPRIRRRFIRIAVAVAAAGAVGIAAAVASTSVEPTLKAARAGVVVDAETLQPLTGVQVVARWWHTSTNRFPPIGHGKPGGFANCLHREIAQTDATGRYQLPAMDGAFVVERTIDLTHKDDYYWQLDGYLAGYYDATVHDSDRPLHPPVTKDLVGSAAELAPFKLTRDARPRAERVAYLTGWGLDFSCKWTTTEPVPFLRDIYAEALRLACQSGEPTGTLAVATLRQEARSAMPPLANDIAQGLDAIKGRYRPNEAVSPMDAAQVCALLTQTREVAL